MRWVSWCLQLCSDALWLRNNRSLFPDNSGQLEELEHEIEEMQKNHPNLLTDDWSPRGKKYICVGKVYYKARIRSAADTIRILYSQRSSLYRFLKHRGIMEVSCEVL